MAEQVPSLLAGLLVINQRQAAEAQLQTLSIQPGFLPYLLQIVLNPSHPITVRQSACLYLKNQIKNRWSGENDDPPVPDADKKTIRDNIINCMVQLSASTDKLLRAQVGEAVAIVARQDFPDAWPDLIPRLVSTLSQDNFSVNLSVLQTAHSVFASWRSAIRSDTLYSTINLVLGQFQEPYFAIFRATANHLLSSNISSPADILLYGDVMDILFNLYYDMVAQDLPPAFEDAHAEFFGDDSQEGWFIRFLAWNPPTGDVDDTPTPPIKIRTTILEICELYTQRYSELSSPRLPIFVRAVWQLVSSTSQAVREDAMVAQAIHFLSVNVKSNIHTALFRDQATLEALCSSIVVPSMTIREHEEEQFEDDPLEYIRRDLSLSFDGAGATRRQAASELVRALIGAGLESEVTNIIKGLYNQKLASYASSASENWRDKDTAIHLFTSIAVLGSTSSQGVTSVNALVNVVEFFSANVATDLQGQSAHPILQVDAIRFIYLFRNQLTKDELLMVLPLLIHHLNSDNYVTYTYASIAIERILFVKENGVMKITQNDIKDIAAPILVALLGKIRKQTTPQKIAENDYLIKCVMRVIVTAKQALIPIYRDVLNNLVFILNQIASNPSNPTFDQYCFESVSALIKFTITGDSSALPVFEETLFTTVKLVLQTDIDQYVPYVLQIVAQMLELNATSIPVVYNEFFPLIVVPAVWSQKGSVPPLVRLVKAYLHKDAAGIVSRGQLAPILGVVQQRLIPSKINDHHGFEVIEAVVTYVPPTTLQQHFTSIMIGLLTRLQGTRTEKYAERFVAFLCFMCACNAHGLAPTFILGVVDSVQAGLWSSLLTGVIVPQVALARTRDRRVIAVGLARLLTDCPAMLAEPYIKAWPRTVVALFELLSTEAFVGPSDPTTGVEPQELSSAQQDLTTVDHEELNAGYQAAYARLAASESKPVDPVAYVGPDLVGWVKRKILEASAGNGNLQAALWEAAEQSPVVAQALQ